MSDRNRKNKKKNNGKLVILIIIALALLVILILLVTRLIKTNSASSTAGGASSAVSMSTVPSSESVVTPSEVSESNASEASKEQTSSAQTQMSTASVTSADTSGSGETLTLTENQKYTGNLILVNSDYAYNFDANADTIDLVTILDVQSFAYPVSKSDFQVARRIMQPLDDVIKACNDALGTSVTGIESAYRTKEYQQQVYDEAEQTYGKNYADKYVATPGYSEHHTGLAVDFGIIAADGTESSFSESDNATWMEEHSSEYGFVRRFAEDKASITKVNNEAWHFRYVGIPHATYMTQNNLCLEEYISYLRDNTSSDKPLVITVGDASYQVYFTSNPVISKPTGDYTVSGNNVDGWIITITV